MMVIVLVRGLEKLNATESTWIHRFVSKWGIPPTYIKLIWVCLKMLCTSFYPMVLLIIIPFLNGYFIGKINPTFSDKPIFASRNILTNDVILGYHGVTFFSTKLLDTTRSGIFAVWGLPNTGWNSWERRTCNVGKAMITPIFWWPVYGKIGDGAVTIALRTSYVCRNLFTPQESIRLHPLSLFRRARREMSVDVNTRHISK